MTSITSSKEIVSIYVRYKTIFFSAQFATLFNLNITFHKFNDSNDSFIWIAFFLSFAVALPLLFCQNTGTDKSAVSEAARG